MASLMTIDFYAYWNGPQVAELFSLVAALTNTADYVTLMKCCAILSLVAAVAMACVRNRGGDIITWFGATILFFMIAFVPRVTVNVVDVRALSARAVENVPIGVGFTAGLSSSVGSGSPKPLKPPSPTSTPSDSPSSAPLSQSASLRPCRRQAPSCRKPARFSSPLSSIASRLKFLRMTPSSRKCSAPPIFFRRSANRAG